MLTDPQHSCPVLVSWWEGQPAYLGAGPAGGGGGGTRGRGGLVCEGEEKLDGFRCCQQGGPSLPSPASAHARSRGGDRSHLSYFSLVIWSSRECRQARARPGLPVAEAPGARTTSGLRAACCPARWLGATAALGGLTRKGFSDRNPNRWCQRCFPPLFRCVF